MAKEPFELKWVQDLLPEPTYIRKSMFGGFAYYRGESLVLALFESKDSQWQGVLFPIERELHTRALETFPFLAPHSILSKWLYLPMANENFEDQVQEVIRAVKKPGSYWGVIPKSKTKNKDVLNGKSIDKSKLKAKKPPSLK